MFTGTEIKVCRLCLSINVVGIRPICYAKA